MYKHVLTRMLIIIALLVMLGITDNVPAYGQSPDDSGPVFVDIVLDPPTAFEEIADNPALGLTSQQGGADTLLLPASSTATELGGAYGPSYKLLPPQANSALLQSERYDTYTTVTFWYQTDFTYNNDELRGEGIYDDYFTPTLVRKLTDAVTLMSMILNRRDLEVLECGSNNTLSDLQPYVFQGNSNNELDRVKLSRDLRATFNSNKNVHIVIGAFEQAPGPNAKLASAFTWSAPLQTVGGQVSILEKGGLNQIQELDAALIGLNLNTNEVIQESKDVAGLASSIFHEILHNYGFKHTDKGGSASNDEDIYLDRTKAILALQDCMYDEIVKLYPDLLTQKVRSQAGLSCLVRPGPDFSDIWNEYYGLIGCPVTEQKTIPTLAEEIFQGGHMFWRSDTDEVYIVYDKDKESGEERFAGDWEDNEGRVWDQSNPDGVGMSPPGGLVEPKRGFGWLWRNFLGGPDSRLGWALDQEYGFDNLSVVQEFENGRIFKGSDPKVFILVNERTNDEHPLIEGNIDLLLAKQDGLPILCNAKPPHDPKFFSPNSNLTISNVRWAGAEGNYSVYVDYEDTTGQILPMLTTMFVSCDGVYPMSASNIYGDIYEGTIEFIQAPLQSGTLSAVYITNADGIVSNSLKVTFGLASQAAGTDLPDPATSMDIQGTGKLVENPSSGSEPDGLEQESAAIGGVEVDLAWDRPHLSWLPVPASEFIMGSDFQSLLATTLAECNETEGNCRIEWFAGELPQHIVFVDDFEITKYEVTNTQYNACVEAGDCSNAGRYVSDTNIAAQSSFFADQNPVVAVNAYDAANFCSWIGGRLPTEAEWEKAARGTDGRRYPWGNTFDQTRANLSSQGPAPVGSFPTGASVYGVEDMAGNVFEWTASRVGDSVVLRGGGWNNFYFRGRVTDRGTRLDPYFSNYDIGFRCVRSVRDVLG